MALLTFVFTIVGISLSGVMAPGPILVTLKKDRQPVTQGQISYLLSKAVGHGQDVPVDGGRSCQKQRPESVLVASRMTPVGYRSAVSAASIGWYSTCTVAS